MLSDREYQIKNLSYIFETASMAPAFHPNPILCVGELEGKFGYIAYSDVMAYSYTIRVMPEGRMMNGFADDKTAVIKAYKSIEEIIDDGWRLD